MWSLFLGSPAAQQCDCRAAVKNSVCVFISRRKSRASSSKSTLLGVGYPACAAAAGDGGAGWQAVRWDDTGFTSIPRKKEKKQSTG